MKILVATEIYWPYHDGGSVFERNLVHGLIALGHKVRVVTPSATGKEYQEKDAGSVIHRIRSVRVPTKFGNLGARSSWFPRGPLRKILDDFKPDVIHAHNPFWIGRSAQKLAKERHIPFVATNHNMPENTRDNVGVIGKLVPDINERVWHWQMAFLNRADFVTSPTKTAVDMLLDHGLTAPHRPVSNGVDVARYRPGEFPKELASRYELPAKPIVLYMGRLDGEKKMNVWLDAVPLIRQHIDAHFLIGGRGTAMAALERQAAALGMTEHVTFAGRVEDDDLPAFYRLGDVFAIASPAELQSLVTLEAMASGLPVVVCDAAALPELCQSGRNGYLFLSGDPAGMSAAVVRILQNPSMAAKMGTESRRIVTQEHDLTHMPQEYEAVYREVTETA